MGKKILITIVVVLIVVLIIVFRTILANESSKKLELTYKISAGIPFRWEYEIEDEDIVYFDKSYVIKDENKGGKVGAPIYTNYVFKGRKKGKTTITFKFVNFTTNTVESEEKHTVRVDKNNNISLIIIPEE